MRRQQAQHGIVLDQSQYPPGFEFRPEWEREAALHLAWFATHQKDIDIGELRVDGIKFGTNRMKTLTIDALINALIVSPFSVFSSFYYWMDTDAIEYSKRSTPKQNWQTPMLKSSRRFKSPPAPRSTRASKSLPVRSHQQGAGDPSPAEARLDP